MTVSPRLRRLLTFALVAAAFVFLGREIARNASELRSFDWSPRPDLLALSTLLLSLVLVWGVMVWQMVLRRFGVETRLRPLARAWFLANLSRYIPGVVWQFISLARLGGSAGLSGAGAVTSQLVHMGFTLLSAALMGIYLLPAAFSSGVGELLSVRGARALEMFVVVMRWVAPLAVLLVHPAVIRRATALVVRLTRRETAPWQGSWGDGVALLLFSCFSWLIYGCVFFLFLNSLVALPLSALPAAIAINALSFLVGYAVLIAPGGLGFKEMTMAVLLGALVPAPVAASLAVASRLWTIVAELAPALLLLRQHAPAAASGDVEGVR